MLVGEYMPVGAVLPTIPLYAPLDTEATQTQRTFAVDVPTRFQGLPPGLPGARYYPGMGQFKFDPYQSRKYRYSGLGQQVSPRGFGQQQSASGRVAGKSSQGYGMFGLNAVVPMEPIMAPVSARPTDVQLSQFAFDPYQSRKYRYSGLGQQVSPRGFGQQQSASGRVAGKTSQGYGLFGLGLPMMPGAEGATVEEANDLFGVDDSLF